MPKIKLVPIGHKLRLDYHPYRDNLHQAVRIEATVHHRLWRELTSKWTHPADWKKGTASMVSGGALEAEIFTYHEILSHLNYGSSGWVQFVSKRRPFRSGYRRATRPGSIRAGKSARYGAWRSIGKNTMVQNKGFPGRYFDRTMVEQRQDAFTANVVALIAKANKQAWIKR